MQIAGNLVAKISHQVVTVLILPNGWRFEERAPAVFPWNALRYKAATAALLF
jgi:hypothetical protein